MVRNRSASFSFAAYTILHHVNSGSLAGSDKQVNAKKKRENDQKSEYTMNLL